MTATTRPRKDTDIRVVPQSPREMERRYDRGENIRIQSERGRDTPAEARLERRRR